MAKAKRKPAKTKRKTLTASSAIRAAAAKSAKRAAKGALIRQASAGKPVKAAAKRTAALNETPILHGLFLSLPSCKVGLALAMMGVKHAYRHVDLMGGAHREAGFLAMNRFGQVPVLEHRGQVIAQSNVILRYLADSFGKFGGRSDAEKLRVAEWLQWDQDRLALGVGGPRAFARFMPQPPDVVNFVKSRGDQALDFLDRHLANSKFLVGAAPTIADIAVFPWVATAEEGGFEMSRRPNLQAWCERFIKLPGAAHPYNVMPRESRDPA
jgi:glutathione S-transferase